MNLRHAEASDAAAIAAIWNPVIRDSLITFNAAEKTDADIATLIEETRAAGHAFLLAEEADGIAGFGLYGQFRKGVGYARTVEHTIILAPSAQGRGIGRALLTALEDHARAGGAHMIFAGVSAANPHGRAFHAACGYVERATLPEVGFKKGRWLDLHLMQKRLSGGGTTR